MGERVLVEVDAEPRDALVDPPLVELLERHAASGLGGVEDFVGPLRDLRFFDAPEAHIGREDIAGQEVADRGGLDRVLDQETGAVSRNHVEVGADAAGGGEEEGTPRAVFAGQPGGDEVVQPLDGVGARHEHRSPLGEVDVRHRSGRIAAP